MSCKVTEGIQSSNLSFLNLRKRQNVSKSKLKEELVQKAWNTCSSGFGGNNLAYKDEPRKTLGLKSDNAAGSLFSVEKNTKTLYHSLTGTEYKSVKRKSMLEIGNIDSDFFPPPSQLLNSTQFLQILKKPERGRKDKRNSDIVCVTKKQKNPLFQSIENPFEKDISNTFTNPPIKVCSGPQTTSVSAVLPEQENVFKKRKVPDGTFTDQSFDFPPPCAVKEVLKKNIAPSVHHSGESSSFTAVCKKKVNNSLTPVRIYKSEEEINQHSMLQSNNKSILSYLNTTKVCQNNSSVSKGSNWVQSLQWTPTEQEDSDHQEKLKKRKLRNVLPNGYAELLLKLQRREMSEKIIWKHKMDNKKEKVLKNTLTMLITAISHAPNIVIANCTCLDFPTSSQNSECINTDDSLLPITPPHNEIMNSEAFPALPQSKPFLVLFKKSHFRQLHMKVKGAFRLHPPWQILKSSHYTIILSTYFVECIPQSPENNFIEERISEISGLNNNPPSLKRKLPSTAVSKEPQCSITAKELFFHWGESLSLYGRVQRIWYHQIQPPENFSNTIKRYRFSLLLQEQEGTFYEVILPTPLPDMWLQFATSAEGKCFGFHNLRLTHRLPLKEHKLLLKFLETCFDQQIDRDQWLDQEFCYQLMLDISSNVCEEVNSENYPPYFQSRVEPMSTLLEGSTVHRFSCIGNVFFEYKNVFYISDESLLYEPLTKYFQLQLLFPFETKSLLGSTVFIREALFSEGHLVLDKYSNFTVLSGSSSLPQNLGLCNKKKLKRLTLVKLQSLVMPLSSFCKATDIVRIEGVIISVNESTAFSFLQCCFCLQENLVQDTNLVIYCEDCSQIVPKPILEIKLEVSVCCQGLDSVSVHIQLLSTTIKKILQLSDDVQQPHCRVADVLGRKVGPLICYIRSCDSTGSKQIFHLSEVQSS